MSETLVALSSLNVDLNFIVVPDQRCKPLICMPLSSFPSPSFLHSIILLSFFSLLLRSPQYFVRASSLCFLLLLFVPFMF